MNKDPFGSKGDFITAPNISILFSEMIAVWTIAFWQKLKCPKKINLVELGSGNGEMILHMLSSFEKFQSFKKSCKIFLLEKSPFLRKIQKKKLKQFKVKWIKNLNEIKTGPKIFLANEFFDALPIKQFFKINNEWLERYVDIADKKNPKFTNKKINIKKFEKKIGFKISKNQKIIEFSPLTIKLMKQISKKLINKNGGLLIIDYGYLNNSMMDSLQAVKNHKKVNILKNYGSTDITYKISFKTIEKISKYLHLKSQGITTQRKFLLKLGILERAEIISKKLPFSKKADIYFRLKRLIDKNQMGELFKVMLITNKKTKFQIGF
jgi:cyclopropane-fatty-acyl-phospholipid synthase